jgi:hypothetical protein
MRFFRLYSFRSVMCVSFVYTRFALLCLSLAFTHVFFPYPTFMFLALFLSRTLVSLANLGSFRIPSFLPRYSRFYLFPSVLPLTFVASLTFAIFVTSYLGNLRFPADIRYLADLRYLAVFRYRLASCTSCTPKACRFF